jgi:hypothetical protein
MRRLRAVGAKEWTGCDDETSSNGDTGIVELWEYCSSQTHGSARADDDDYVIPLARVCSGAVCSHGN